MKLGSLIGLAALSLLAVAPASVAGAQDAHTATPAAAPAAQHGDSTRNALDSAAAFSNREATQEVQHGTGAPVTGGHGAEGAQGAHGAADHRTCVHHDPKDIITPHITDSNCIEVPTLRAPFATAVPVWPFEHRLMLGSLDITPTKHVVMLLIAALLTTAVLVTAAVAHKRHHHAAGRPKGFAAGIEAMVLFIRNEVAIPNLGGHGGYKYAPFILTLFFFILFCNLLGLIPYGATATGNISVTATLAIVTFLMIEFAGIRAQGLHYLNTIFYWNKDLNIVMRVLMFVIMTPVEIAGKISKPFALAIRLFANMTAGHIVVLALIGLIFTFAGLVSTAPFLMAVAIMMLELFVAFLQAFIFSLLASVFIGQIREAHH